MLFGWLPFDLLLAVLFLFEGVDGWLAGLLLLFAFAGADACFAGVEGPRACFGDMAGALYGAPADLAATTPLPLNSPGLAAAAIAGRPWFSDAKFCLFWLAMCSCRVCAASRWVWCSCCALSSSCVGRATTPPSPPLKATWFSFTITVLL